MRCEDRESAVSLVDRREAEAVEVLCGSEMRKTPTKSAHSRSGTRRTTILTISHSTRSVGTFIQMLEAYGVKRLVDVRTIPRSRHNPQINRDVLPATAASGRHWVHAHGGTGQIAPPPERLTQHGMAQHFVPRLRRLYANARIPNGHHDTHSSRKTRASRNHVRRATIVDGPGARRIWRPGFWPSNAPTRMPADRGTFRRALPI